MKIGENSGLINALTHFLSPVLCRLFPDIPKGHPVLGSIFMNMSANMLGLDNAATPLGLKAMKELQELNPNKDTASNPMIMFLVINTSVPYHHSNQYHGVSCTNGGCTAYGCIYPYPAKYFHFNFSRSHSSQYRSKDKLNQ